ncbi:MAG: hypothetical protein A2234_07645 [Elusimicrobia bacterium RIFOXYA2_FULL_58_8]|nr:MAG: hypothetical protein A2234_07645 [Elusimicrobia bacterium RIFOXYA2_FULL_58_8]
MYLGKGFLSLALCASQALLAVQPALAAHDPLAFAQGVWQGRADNGHEKYTLTVTVKKNGSLISGSSIGKGTAGGKLRATFSSVLDGKGRKVSVSVMGAAVPLRFEVQAVPNTGTELQLFSFIGDGSLKFRNDFTKAEFELRSLATSVTATLYRTDPPPPQKKPGGRRSGEKKAPSMPPMVIRSK